MTLSIDICTDVELWDSFVSASPQGNIFCSSPFLESLQESFVCYMVCEDDKPCLAIPVNESTPEFIPFGHYTTFRFAIYQGPMFAKEVEELPIHSGAALKLKLMDFALGELTARHKQLRFTLHPQFSDVRSFQWHNYHNEAGGRFDINLRYTGLLDLQSSSQENLLSEVRTLRKREFQRSQKEGVICEVSEDLDILDRLDDLVFERQELARDLTDQEARRSIAASALGHGYGRLLVAKLSTGEVASAYLCLFDHRCAYYLFAGNHPDTRKSGASTYLMFNALEKFRQEGKHSFDFIGLNSPLRGDFKTSFNAAPKAHYLVQWQRPN